MTMRIAFAIFAIALLLGCDDREIAPGSAAPAPDVRHVASDYKTLALITRKPVYVDPGLAALCRGATQQQIEEAQKVSGPHAHTAIKIYMNDLAAGAFNAAAGKYPVESVIVKEKSGLTYIGNDQTGEKSTIHDGVGGMIKRAPGYDPSHGDWEYFYFEDPEKLESGKISSCVNCHAGAANKDHVFGTWAAGE